MKILYSDTNVRHINPTVNILPRLFRDHFSDAHFYGPGFQPQSVLDQGINKYIESNGPFDAVVVGHNTPILVDGENPLERTINFQDRATAHSLEKSSRMAYFKDLRNALGTLEVSHKIVSAINVDYYATTEAQIDNLISRDCLIIGPNEQFVTLMEDLPGFVTEERHYSRNLGRFSNVWHDYLQCHPEKVITALHFIDSDEAFFEPLQGRKFDVAVPGAEYVLRKQAIKSVAREKFKTASKLYFHLYRLGNFIGVPTYSHETFLHLYNILFLHSLRNTKCVYSAKGGFGIPIRKFFEIPAAGSLLMCSPPKGYDLLGFNNGEHYLDVEPESLSDSLRHWLNADGAQNIASAGQQLVLQKHSLVARASQIKSCLDAIGDGTYKGARWIGGNYCLN